MAIDTPAAGIEDSADNDRPIDSGIAPIAPSDLPGRHMTAANT
jgi:hypothetical protein